MTIKTKHPCKGMTRAQIAAFERIAVNQPPGATHKTLASLRERGMIAYESEVIGRDVFGPITVPRWYVPLAILSQWCKWCSEQPGEEP